MKIVRILGGLGNQMFQYAFALALSKFYSEDIKIDPKAFIGYPLHDGYLLNDIFNISLEEASVKNICKVNYPIFHYKIWQISKHILPKHHKVYFEKEDMVFDKNVFELSKKCYLDGYWQSEKYFSLYKDAIYRDFTFPILDEKNAALVKEFIKSKTVSIHVRRGDYLNHPLFKDLSDLNYYKRAIEYLDSNTKTETYLIFSNDIVWCKENITNLLNGKKIIFVDWNKGKDSFRDMQLMSLCNHNVVANSSFSWWGAWLNRHEDKIVIAPRKWMNVDRELDIIPQSWIKV
ncbi:alpha-1,2-fucosyltransferase [Lepagella muris]|jgi:hypothetical protein|uniref:Alpha-1,2-fucosyltransferase n=1 Tax=Lepagella muris TaxID=3032870 RepID=A0AC61RCZ8_9BACT|nr:alpha-1,2-fucosyltransferase [Lepagella muris]ROT07338.1 alpha-1,2-fucosyltransferase [Muribaculaceae bacterium Isolate-037 (Harlan)]TGY75992.1 alpha-1,2-fucosyltransferase [Lepagella muris]THG46563.1 alpha-1,2-fucosyltransferase [Bacteroidales bacterium]TKC55039.1 alpha-1,2-fucosyltransferase [Bacteroidales bacterium]